MRDHSHHIQLTREEAVRQMLVAVDELPGGFGWCAGEVAKRSAVERVSVPEACGRVLAADVRARATLPTCLTCAMDSIAVRFDAFEAAAAGGALPDTTTWERGRDWEFANTGTAMPAGFDTAIVVEHVAFSEDGERVLAVDAAPSARFAGTRPAGSTMREGDVLATAGSVVSPDIAARIAGGNVSTVPVARRPRVAFIPTGDELQTPGSPFVAAGKNIETNSVLCQLKVEGWGGIFVPFQTVRDRREEIHAALAEACGTADIVVLNAGSSKGSGDWSCEVMEEMGRVICHQTNHGPGHHSSYAVIKETPVVGISGPSGGASPTMDFYLRPLIRHFLGLETVVPRVSARLVEPFPAAHAHGHKGARVPGRPLPGEKRPLEDGPDGFFAIRFLNVAPGPDGTLEARPVVGGPGSAAVAACNAYCMVPTGPGVEPPQVGCVLQVEFR